MKFLSAHINTESTWRGGEQQTLYLLEGLRRRGYPVALIAAPETPLHERAAVAGFETHGLTIRSDADLKAVFRAARILRRVRPDLLHLHTPRAHTIGVCAALLGLKGVKRVVSRRVNFSIYRHSFLGLNGFKYRHGVDRYLAVSASVRDVLVRDGVRPERTRVVHSGVDPERFRDARKDQRSRLLKEWRLPEGVPLVGTVSALVPSKGIGVLIEAAAAIRAHRDCAFVVAGDGPLHAEISAQVDALGLADRFRLVGFRSDVGDILEAFDVFAFPSLEEGLGTSLLDALLLARPTVAAGSGGIPEVIRDGENGLLADPGDAVDLAARIEEVLDDPERGRRLGEAGRRTVLESFSADAMVEKTLAAYRELLP